MPRVRSALLLLRPALARRLQSSRPSGRCRQGAVTPSVTVLSAATWAQPCGWCRGRSPRRASAGPPSSPASSTGLQAAASGVELCPQKPGPCPAPGSCKGCLSGSRDSANVVKCRRGRLGARGPLSQRDCPRTSREVWAQTRRRADGPAMAAAAGRRGSAAAQGTSRVLGPARSWERRDGPPELHRMNRDSLLRAPAPDGGHPVFRAPLVTAASGHAWPAPEGLPRGKWGKRAAGPPPRFMLS